MTAIFWYVSLLTWHIVLGTLICMQLHYSAIGISDSANVNIVCQNTKINIRGLKLQK